MFAGSAVVRAARGGEHATVHDGCSLRIQPRDDRSGARRSVQALGRYDTAAAWSRHPSACIPPLLHHVQSPSSSHFFRIAPSSRARLAAVETPRRTTT